MPKLWNATIETHRQAVHEAIMDTAAALATEHGLRAVTMAQIAEGAGIGRATLYKYFPDVDSILAAWHERQIGAHLEQMAALSHGSGTPAQRLHQVLETYALIQHRHHGSELAAQLHHGDRIDHAKAHLVGFLRGLIEEGVGAGGVRDDVAPEELAQFCLHALGAATALRSEDGVRRLVTVTLAGLHTPH